jgi:tellurite resistance protein TehA-like permease
MSQHHAYKLIRAACIGLGALAATTLAIVTVVAERTGSTPAVFAAMPGIICHLLITGGHGGTHAEEVAGSSVAILVNASLGAACFFLVFAVFRHLNQTQPGVRDVASDDQH